MLAVGIDLVLAFFQRRLARRANPEQPRGGGLSDLPEFPLLPELERA